ncbi:hypothetical protein LCGC14_2103780, partial [marine sediment metagenome]
MLKEILYTLAYVVGGMVLVLTFIGIRKWIIKRGLNIVKGKKSNKEVFEWKKFKKIFSLGSAAEWAKSIKEIIDLRKFLIYATILITIWGFGYYRGLQTKPIKMDIGYGKEVTLKLDKNFLHIGKDGIVRLVDKNKKVIKVISVKDIPELRRKLSPYGFQLKPIGIAGASIGRHGDTAIEAGAGVSVFRVYKAELDAFLTGVGAYVGTSYKITDNAGIGLGIGKGYKRFDDRVIVYGKI